MIEILEPEIHVWWLSLESEPPAVERSFRLLSTEEQARADRFHFPRDRRRFVLARASLRMLLGDYTGEAPARVSLQISSSGKPFLADRANLHFNLSHCEDRGVLAIARRPIGVDLERLRAVPEALSIAGNLFAPSESGALRAFPAELRSEAFLRCWTRKEAYVKARGVGLSVPLTSFEVTLDDGPPRLSFLEEPAEGKWSLHDVGAGPGWTGAIAVQLESPRLMGRVFPVC